MVIVCISGKVISDGPRLKTEWNKSMNSLENLCMLQKKMLRKKYFLFKRHVMEMAGEDIFSGFIFK